jgi:predicted GTPase
LEKFSCTKNIPAILIQYYPKKGQLSHVEQRTMCYDLCAKYFTNHYCNGDTMTAQLSVVIAGAAGRDFHDFNMLFHDQNEYRVVGFTATQIPNIEGRLYPPELAGSNYPEGIPIYPEGELEDLIGREGIDQVVFSYSDVSHEYVMHLASKVLAAGADFRLISPRHTQILANKPVVSIGAVRTGSGKSQTSRKVVRVLQQLGYRKVVAIRHPMPYGSLRRQAVQRFASYEDLVNQDCTIEEREEYEPYIAMEAIIYAGVNYQAILSQVEEEADIIVWDGGNNDVPFLHPDHHIVVTDPHRAGHELRYHPGETNLRIANTAIINKIDTANREDIVSVRRNIQAVNPSADIIMAASPITVSDPEEIRGKCVLVIEDGPTSTHGEMGYGAGYIAATYNHAAKIIDPRPYAVGSIVDTFERYPGTGNVLPAMGYGEQQIAELRETINKTPAELVLIATPIDLGRIISIDIPAIRVGYELQEIGHPTLMDILRASMQNRSG